MKKTFFAAAVVLCAAAFTGCALIDYQAASAKGKTPLDTTAKIPFCTTSITVKHNFNSSVFKVFIILSNKG